MFKRGDFVKMNNQVGMVVMSGEEMGGDLKDHTGVWFGTLATGVPEVWTIPTDYLQSGPEPLMKH